MSKYRNKKTQVDGIWFDSKKEAERYLELKALEQKGEIRKLKLQPVYELQPSFEHKGKKYRAITYRADFEYERYYVNIGQVQVRSLHSAL